MRSGAWSCWLVHGVCSFGKGFQKRVLIAGMTYMPVCVCIASTYSSFVNLGSYSLCLWNTQAYDEDPSL